MTGTDTPTFTGVPPEWRRFCAAVLTWAAQQLHRDGALQGVAFLGKVGDDHIATVPIDARSPEHKDASAAAIAQTAQQIQADAILFVIEAWTLREACVNEAEALIAKYGSLGNMPDTYKEEVMMASLETASGLWVARAPILRDDRMAGVTLGVIDFERMQGMTGRFTHLLPASSGHAPLH